MCSGVSAVRRSCPASSRSTRCEGSSLRARGRDPLYRTDYAVDDDGTASAAVLDGLRVGIAIVQERPVGIERPVLYDNGHVVDAVRTRQTEAGVGAVIDHDQSREAHVDLPGRVMVQMRMKPGSRGRLIDLESRTPCAAGLDDLVRSAVNISGHQKSVPVHRRVEAEGILDDHLHLVAAAHADSGPKDGPRVTVSLRQLTLEEGVPSG